MSGRIPQSLQQEIENRLRYYEDLGIRPFYRDRLANTGLAPAASRGDLGPVSASPAPESSLPRSISKIDMLPTSSKPPAPLMELGTKSAELSLFDSANRILDDTLLKIRADIGDCTRCKLHKGRRKIVFDDGNAVARLMFVGEGPGADEDMQGVPFVGRAGKLLTQMIEAMGLRRQDVYICNVVKCRPPENRTPEPDEVETCSPYLLRQVDVVNPRVIVCLGAVATKTLLETNRGISQFRGQWIGWRGRKLMATYHPAYLLRNPAAKGEVWKDLQKVMVELGLPLAKRAKS